MNQLSDLSLDLNYLLSFLTMRCDSELANRHVRIHICLIEKTEKRNLRRVCHRQPSKESGWQNIF